MFSIGDEHKTWIPNGAFLVERRGSRVLDGGKDLVDDPFSCIVRRFSKMTYVAERVYHLFLNYKSSFKHSWKKKYNLHDVTSRSHCSQLLQSTSWKKKRTGWTWLQCLRLLCGSLWSNFTLVCDILYSGVRPINIIPFSWRWLASKTYLS